MRQRGGKGVRIKGVDEIRRPPNRERSWIKVKTEAVWNFKHDAHNGPAHISLSRNDPNEEASNSLAIPYYDGCVLRGIRLDRKSVV